MNRTIYFAVAAVLSLGCCQYSVAQTLSDSERYAAMDKNRVFLAEVDEYRVSDVLRAEGIERGYVDNVPVAIYKVIKTSGYVYCYGIVFGREVTLSDYQLKFVSEDDSRYLLMRGTNGEAARKEAARRFDKVKSEEYRTKVAGEVALERQRKEQERKKSLAHLQYLRKNRAIVWDYSLSESYGDYTLKLQIYNWFTKRIKYLDCTVVAVNSVGDPRWYSIERSMKTIQCVGYVNSLSSNTFVFEDLFYDSSEVIDDILIVNATITFEDNTKISINSREGASKMYVDNHDISLSDDFFDHIK